ncbi:MAG: tetratricopeptide repeat protein [Candidatus Coatesbacteria bacterium]|nr:tetratricopeptide repeat protein [Candidatus Coatesbacteria bacterium]
MKRFSGPAVVILSILALMCLWVGCFHEADYLSPEARTAFGYAMDLWRNGDRQGAISAFERAGELTSADNWEAFSRYCIGEIYQELDDPASSQAAIRAAEAKLGPLPEVVAAAGECYMNLDMLEDARIEFRKALKGRLDGARKISVSYELGIVCTELGYFSEAEENFRRVLGPQFPKAYRGYARLLDRMGRGSEAHNQWRAYLDSDPNGEFSDEAREHLNR